jgi:ribosome biogenesis GTPase
MAAPQPTADPIPHALAAWGWSAEQQAAFGPLAERGLEPARVTQQHRDRYVVADAAGERAAIVSGRFRHATRRGADFPAVGDWVAVEMMGSAADLAIIDALLPRRSAFSRAAALTMAEQVVAANVDLVFVVMSLNRDFNLRRLERYVATAWESGAQPVLILSKADLADDLEGSRLAAEAVAPSVPVIAVSVVTGIGLDDVRAMIGFGKTVALVGSSGVGKSTLVNALAGRELMPTAEVRLDDARGRHMTTIRQLFRLEDGLVLDTPGLRELGLLDDEGLSDSFVDVLELAARCRFGDCAHATEPGCAVRIAVVEGRLDKRRLDAYDKLVREARYAERKSDAFAREAERRRWRNISRSVGAQMKAKYGDAR